MNTEIAINRIEKLERVHLTLDQVDCDLVHRFSRGVYLREIHMPAGTFIIGQQHKTTHFNIILKGSAAVHIDGEERIISAPCTFESGPGVRKVLLILEDMIWQTVHVTNETDLGVLEELLIEKSESYLEHEANQLALTELLRLKEREGL